MNSFCDILWVEDEHEVEEYFSDEQSFRVNRQKYMLKLLEDLESEENFSRYSCAILDINLENGFGYYDTIDDEEERSESDELKAIENILKRNQILIRPEHNLDEHDDNFKKNAGYYVYLYLVDRGMPPARICMLTANAGKNLNLTGAWEGNFESAGLKPPEAFDRSLVKFGDAKEDRLKFESWLEGTLTPAFRLRSCIIGMSFYAEKLLDSEITKLNKESDENKRKEILDYEAAKIHVQNLYRIPLRLSEDKEKASPEFISALWQILQIWESHEDSNRAYQMTLKTARNWFAHRCLKKTSLLTAAFLFGIGMRGLLGEKIRRNLDDIFEDKDWKKTLSSLKTDIKGYKLWEDELLSLIEELDKEKSSDIKPEINEQLVIKSCQEFFTRIENAINDKKSKGLKIYFTSDICNLIQETIGQKIINKKENNINRYEEDLLRDFIHGVYSLNWNYNRLTRKLEISLRFDSNVFESLKNSKEAKYLNAVKNTLTLAINR